ncbi:MAG TPA: hypothetical protein VIQ00_02285 [Chitinophagaceae bacterium]|jgi:hypothetical protein
MLKTKFRPFTPVIIIFIIVNSLLVAGRTSFESRGFDQGMLIYANLLLFAATFFSYLLSLRGLKSTNPHAFVRAIMGSMMLKMVLCLAAVLAYILMNRDNINKASLFGAMGLYLVYTFVEVSVLMKQAKQKENVKEGSAD